MPTRRRRKRGREQVSGSMQSIVKVTVKETTATAVSRHNAMIGIGVFQTPTSRLASILQHYAPIHIVEQRDD
jgi:hypothetical protein